MLENIEKTINMAAKSVIGDTVAVQFRAVVTEDGTANISKIIRNIETYNANQVTCDADNKEFEEIVLKAVEK